MRRLFFLLLISIAAFFIVLPLAYSQGKDTGAIEGRALDEGGAPLPGATVKLSSFDLIGGSQSRVTDSNGRFRFVLLPRGTYRLEATLQGFVEAKADNIRLFVGQTLTIDLSLKIAKLEEQITVIGIASLVDVKDSQIMTTNLDRQMIETVGATRSKLSTGLIDLAPGSVSASVMGAPARTSNNWQIDGMNATWLGPGSDGSYPDITILEDVQVSGTGANAEYGNFMGAALNLITKSGGNSLEGFAEVTYSPLGWTQKNIDVNKPIFSLYSAPPRKLYFDAHVGIGGPIIKDKLWFYVSGGTMQNDTEIAGFSERYSWRLPSWFLKFTFQPDARNRFQVFWQMELYKVLNRGLSPRRPVAASYYDYGPDTPANLSYFHTFSDKTFLEIRTGFWNLWYEQRPNNGRNVPERLDYNTGMYSGNYGWWGEEHAFHVTVNAALSHHADEFIKGSHDFKFGIEYLSGFEKMKGGYPAGFIYSDNVYSSYDNKFHTYAYSYGYSFDGEARKVTVFAQDSWKISDRLTINPGVRYSSYKGTLPNAPDIVFKPKDAIEPRIGLTWDVFGDHTTAIKVHYGKYVDSIKTYYFQGADKAKTDWVMYDVLPDGTKVEIYRAKYSNPTSIDPNIRMPSSNQFSLGLERTLTRNMAVGATFAYREFKNFISKVNMTATWTLIPYTFTNENGQLQTIEVYKKTSPSSADTYMIANPRTGISPSVTTTPKNTYTGLTVFLEKRFSSNWMLHAAYTYSVAKGNYQNTYSAGTGQLRNYLDPNLQINANGHMQYDPTHLLQIYGTFVLPLDLSLSPRFTYISGNTWTQGVRVPVAAGAPTVFIESMGSRRMASTVDLGFRLEKAFPIREKMRAGFILDVFNLLNQGIETAVYSTINVSTFAKASKVNDGRYFRLGARFFF